MNKKLDIERWERKEHFHFFKDFEEPFFGMTVDIDCTQAYMRCKEQGWSFFLYYLHKTLLAANATEPFRYRIDNGEVLIFNHVHASATIARPNETFGFSFIQFEQDQGLFTHAALEEIERVRNSQGLVPGSTKANVIHFSSVPWVKFTSLSHARKFSRQDSCPKIAIGKVTERNGRKEMPVSIHVHHALMDGYHVGQFVEAFQELMNE
jgi:chloramphenicol O-acetyltransferase type A